MREFTFGELKQGLICCTVYRSCAGCPLYRGDDIGPSSVGDMTCTDVLLSAAMNCINIMEVDLDEANKRAACWEETATKYEQEIIRLYESLDER